MLHLFLKKTISFPNTVTASTEKLGSHLLGISGVFCCLVFFPFKKREKGKQMTISFSITTKKMFLWQSDSPYRAWIPSVSSLGSLYVAALMNLYFGYIRAVGSLEWERPKEWPTSCAATVNRLYPGMPSTSTQLMIIKCYLQKCITNTFIYLNNNILKKKICFSSIQ